MIKINEDKLEFHLYTKNTSYLMTVIPSKHLVNLHYGGRFAHQDNFSHLYQNFSSSLGSSTNYDSTDDVFTLDSTRLEVGTNGKGDYREPSLHIKYKDHSRVSDFKYFSYKVINGKPDLDGLPNTFGTEGVKTLIITLYDDIKDVYLHLSYCVFYETDIITRSLQIENGNHATITLQKIMSMNIDFMDSDYELLTLEGKWIREGQINCRELNKGVFYIDSKKGVSGANHNPFICLKRKHTTEENGECYGFGLVYSGNHQGLVEVNPHNLTRLHIGINPFDFSWTLDKGNTFQTPEVVMTYSNSGLSKMSSNFHNMINHNLIPLKWQNRERPILFNNWEATYFGFNEKKLLNLAKSAKNLGIELFVLDDGWFGNRDDDRSSLGDFTEHSKKLPNGLAGLSKKINKLGLDFGIWVEPEMVSIKSNLYKKHPEWAVKLPGREPSLGRHQLILDLSNPDVIQYLYDSLKEVLINSNAKYVKWDMNRNFSDCYSNYLGVEQQEEFSHRYVLGLYGLLNRLTTEFEDVLFESCSSGGNRFDLGMLNYMPQTWISDNTDATERQSIQYGMSMLYPISSMCAHVSGEPSHQVLRNTPIESRFNVAAFGILGYEMDITKLSDFEKKVIKKQIEFYKEHRKLLQFGTFRRLKSPFDNNQSLWMVINEDKSEVLIGYYQKLQESNGGFESIKTPGLIPDGTYTIRNRDQFINIRHFGALVNDELPIDLKINGIIHSLVSERYMYQLEVQSTTIKGDQIMNAGFLPYHQFVGTELTAKTRFIGDFGSRIYHMKLEEEK
ncbi:MAG: alpha-galactosidase [Spirochaetaceae bacterium]